jgi:hypothetical protein
MADRVAMTSPTGLGLAQVAASRVEAFKANGWREVAPKKPVRRSKKADESADEE